jgi:hypothetical protein
VQRGGHLLDKADSHTPFEVGDVIYLVGSKEALRRALEALDPTHTD